MTNPDAPRVTEWAVDPVDVTCHRRTVGSFDLMVDPSSHGAWSWWICVDNGEWVIADGREMHGPDALARAKAACEAAARRAGIAVPR